MRIVTIKEVKGVVDCSEDGTAEHVFNVKNATNKALKVGMQLSASEPARKEWLRIEGLAEHTLDVEAMTQVTVKIKVPSDCAPGKYSYRLRVFDPVDPGEMYTDGDPVFFKVSKKEEEVVKQDPTSKPLKWWIPVTIALGVVLVAGILFLMLFSGPEVATFDTSRFGSAVFR
ncbi:MAG: hypothetical protein P8X90_27430 [Desulfobacterales bacterium]|jgi:hypothetical protein